LSVHLNILMAFMIALNRSWIILFYISYCRSRKSFGPSSQIWEQPSRQIGKESNFSQEQLRFSARSSSSGNGPGKWGLGSRQKSSTIDVRRLGRRHLVVSGWHSGKKLNKISFLIILKIFNN
jgi:hypothetical protein